MIWGYPYFRTPPYLTSAEVHGLPMSSPMAATAGDAPVHLQASVFVASSLAWADLRIRMENWEKKVDKWRFAKMGDSPIIGFNTQVFTKMV